MIHHFSLENKEWLIANQVKIGKNMEKVWSYFFQSNKETLEKKYSAKDFDPETRLYWIQDNAMKGFITAKVVHEPTEDELFAKRLDPPFGMLSVPITYPPDPIIDGKLIDEAIKRLRLKGANTIVCNVGYDWGKKEILLKKGFIPVSALLYREVLPIKADSQWKETRNKCPKKEVARLLSKHIGYSIETALSILENPPSSVHETHEFCIMDGNLKAWCRISRMENEWSMGPVYTEKVPDKKTTEALMKQVISFLNGKTDHLTILCGKQAEHLLENFDTIDFKPAITTYIQTTK